MSLTWNDQELPRYEPPGFWGWLRVVTRGVLLVFVLLTGAVLSIVLRLLELPFFGVQRPLSPYITQYVCRLGFVILGMRRIVSGTPMKQRGAVVCNHASWLDIFSLNATKRIYFVSKAEVASWPGIGWLARLVGTVFIERDRKHAKAQTELFRARLHAGHKLLFFPEGTSTDNMRVLPFKTTLFQSFMDPALRDDIYIQPVSLIYMAPDGTDPRYYGWWGDMDLGPHLITVLATRPQGYVHLVFHPPVRVAEFSDRKALAAHCEAVIRHAMPPARQIGR